MNRLVHINAQHYCTVACQIKNHPNDQCSYDLPSPYSIATVTRPPLFLPFFRCPPHSRFGPVFVAHPTLPSTQHSILYRLPPCTPPLNLALHSALSRRFCRTLLGTWRMRCCSGKRPHYFHVVACGLYGRFAQRHPGSSRVEHRTPGLAQRRTFLYCQG